MESLTCDQRAGWEGTKTSSMIFKMLVLLVWCFTGKETEGFCQNGDMVLSVDIFCLVPSWSHDRVIDS